MSDKILLVDDEIDFLDVVSEFLEYQGYSTTTALNGTDALKLLENDNYDLIISDINMPGMKGYELLKIVSEKYPQTKRVLITAYDVRDYIRFAKDYDIGNIMVKTTPFNFNEISVFISNILSGDIFGLNRYINTEPKSSVITNNKDLEIVNQQVLNFFAGSKHLAKFRQGLGEILINAFFYGAQNESGSEKHLWNMDVELSSDKEISVSWAKDDEKQGVAVTDQKGRLSKEDVLYWIERNTTKNNQGLTNGLTDNHGKGLFITREVVDRMIINIDPGNRTEIILLNYNEGLYEGHRPLWIQEL